MIPIKQILLTCAVVALVGCGKKDDPNTGVVNPNKPSPKAVPEKPIANTILEQLKKPTGELTNADLGKVTELNLISNELTEVPKGLEKLTKLTWLGLGFNQLTDVKGLENLTQLEDLYLGGNPDLTKAQIAELKKALPKCEIRSNPTK
ncbi:hypothetical protein OAK45_04045 [Verrucomicrobia bacterium]|nr:hypothetical protein [Verrucomicrobiota bacterium]